MRRKERIEEVRVVCGDRPDVDVAHSGITVVQTKFDQVHEGSSELTSKSEVAG